MFAYPIRTAALAAAAMIGLSGCAYNGMYSGVGVGIGSGYYDPYYSGYGYGGYGDYAYGAGYPYYGWYDGSYYPGTGYYVYDRYRRAHRWTDDQQRYWESRRKRTLTDGFRSIATNWSEFDRSGTSATSSSVRQISRSVDRPARTERSITRVERGNRPARVERSSARSERRSVVRTDRTSRSNGRHRGQERED